MRSRLLLELIALDIEFNLRRGTETPRSPILEDYLQCFDGQIQSSEIVELILKEYRYRQQWGDQPSLTEFLKRFPDRAGEIEASMREYAAQVTPTVVGIYNDSILQYETRLTSRPLLIGRQRRADPPPFSVSPGADRDRLIIAPRGHQIISRSQLDVSIVCRNGILVRNNGPRPVRIELHRDLMPSTEALVQRPTVLRIEGLAIRLSQR